MRIDKLSSNRVIRIAIIVFIRPSRIWRLALRMKPKSEKKNNAPHVYKFLYIIYVNKVAGRKNSLLVSYLREREVPCISFIASIIAMNACTHVRVRLTVGPGRRKRGMKRARPNNETFYEIIIRKRLYN